MSMLQGIAASQGIAIGKAHKIEDRKLTVTRRSIEDPAGEIGRFHNAIQDSLKELQQIFRKAKQELGDEEAQIFEAHMLVLQDPELAQGVEEKIKLELINAEAALDEISNQYIAMFEAMDNEYMKERAADIRDVSQRVLAHLLGVGYQSASFHEPVVIVANDLTPSDTAQLDKQYVLGFVTDIGGRTSHSAIMARTMEIPAVVGLKHVSVEIQDGDLVVLDGSEGKVIINPSSADLQAYVKRREEFLLQKQELLQLVNEPSITQDGRRVELAANIGTPQDLPGVIQNGAEGIGLFRTEFLYMNRSALPDEEEQFQAYKEAASGMNGKPVIIRTLDIGGDKELPYLNLEKEMNPFLGYRAIRLCLDQQDLFKIQLRAILRASKYGKIKIMYPMISTVQEVRQANSILDEVKQELAAKQIPFDPSIEVGIMVEIPASAMIADILAKEVDFFSIGTNDLIQYTMACDRMNEKISYLYQPYHPAILRLIKQVIDAAHRENKWAGMCGEMAGDPIAAPILLGLGLDEFSMSPSSILQIRKFVKGVKYEDMKQLALEALGLGTQEEIKALVQQRMRLEA
ncbi:phosphoenolpyruvate--protein phosphotransferase [Fodinisporobacter ferrooxydans]|uniref:Phosphoenolpyruvate-protein phosphotransferase n=1 Tax=Fodinisporobacter ferrooxydans TaxID=2901836 RepID=A0ABY4CQ38_9BACL|nr:phosphoenolpyruvate--protein phosphotransferase [Alicyclobacillaceae bacterium MYW30-H2]